jgi:hypothetical protein
MNFSKFFTQTKHDFFHFPSIKRRSKILTFTALTLVFSCRKEEHLPAAPGIQTGLVTTTQKTDINPATIVPEALEYYKNIASIANWYAKNPGSNKRAQSVLDGDTSNTLLAKLSEISILDSNNVPHSIFQVTEAERKEFLETWVLIESDAMSHKLKLDSSRNSIGLITERNEAYRQAFGSNKMELEGVGEDPYWKMRTIMDLNEKQKLNSIHAPNGFQKNLNAEDTFYALAVANKILSVLPIGAAPLKLPVQTFVNRIRPSLRPGRLLIALPGGSNTAYPLVFYPNLQFYDPGHVAIISVNPWQVSGTLDDKTIISMGANSEKGMHEERTNEDWAGRHGLAYVGQVYTTKWVTKWTITHVLWFTTKTPYYVQESRDIDDNVMFYEALALIGKPYCHLYELPTAKWAAPARFICSTTAWWCAKKGADVNIGDFYRPTIFPAGVYLSDRVRIEKSTLN